jgi:hypothetical protein
MKMKKVMVFSITCLLFLFITGCTNNETPGLTRGDEERSTTLSIVAILEGEGYELTNHDAEAVTYFQENTVDDLGVTATVSSLYMGYLDGNNWVQVIGLNSSTEASDLANAFEEEQDEGQLVYLEGNTVVLTYTQATYDLFE